MSENFLQFYHFRNNPEFAERHLMDCLLLHIFSPVILKQMAEKWETLPFYVREEVPPPILKMAFSSNNIEEDLKKYWLEKAVRTLEGYRQTSVPFSKSKCVQKKSYNLLSLKGEEVLSILKEKLEQGIFDDNTVHQAISASNKFLLNMALFSNFNRLKSSTFYTRPQFGRIILSLSSGCYNTCCHCGFGAKPPVSHIPYPVFAQLANFYGHKLSDTYGGTQFYSDSDPLSYRDEIIDADMGDVCRYVKGGMPEFLQAYFVTKGVFRKKDWQILAKAFENSSICLSFVDLPGEKDIAQNMQRIQDSLQALREVPIVRRNGHIIQFRHICVPEDKRKKEDLINNEEVSFVKINPIYSGRWVETCRRKKLPQSYRDYSRRFSSGENIIIKPDGSICECFPSPCRRTMHWNVLDNIFNYMQRE